MRTAFESILASLIKLNRLLLFCSAAFFRGQIEERRNTRAAFLLSSGDLDIMIAVSSAGVYLIQPREGVFFHNNCSNKKKMLNLLTFS